MQQPKRIKKRLSIIYRNPNETQHRKGNINYMFYDLIGVNCILLDNQCTIYLFTHRCACFSN